MAFGIGAHRSLVDEFAVLRDTAGIFSIVSRDRKYVGCAVTALPRLALVGGTSIAQVVVGFDKPSLTPYPADMDGSARIDEELPVGIAELFTIDKDILQAAPFARLDVVEIHDEVAASRRTTAISEEDISRSQTIELWIGDIELVWNQRIYRSADHWFHISQGQ